MLTAILFVAFDVGVAYVFVVWGRWLSRTYGAPRWLRWSGVAASLPWLVSSAVSVLAFARIFHLPADSSPADRQRILANSIAELMYNTAFAIVVQIVAGAIMLFLTWRYRWSKKLPTAEGQPPYR
jgi:hypothetical protein